MPTNTQTTVKDYLFYIFAAAGAVISLLTELEKYSDTVRAICGGDTGGCAEVGASAYSSFLGIPLGLWGLAAYAALVTLYRYRRRFSILFVSAMLGAELFLMYLMFGVLETMCPLCFANFLVVGILFILLMATAAPNHRPEQIRAGGVGVLLAVFLAFFVPFQAMEPGEAIEKRVVSPTSWGDPDSRYRMEIYSDYQCPYCKKYEDTIHQVMSRYPEIYIVFRDFIISSHGLSPMAVKYTVGQAIQYGQEAYMQARFQAFEHQSNLFDHIKPRFDRVRDDRELMRKVDEKVGRDEKQAALMKINSTPTTILVKDGAFYKKVGGFVPFEELKPVLNAFTDREGQ